MLYYNQKEKRKELKKMRFTYKLYLSKESLKKYEKNIEIIEEEKMDLGSMVTFYCENNEVLDEIYGEE